MDTLKTRHSLLERLKDWEDQDSWQVFYETYWRLIYNVALQAGLRPDEAQETVQETVISVSKKIQGFECRPEGGSFKSWLLQLTRWRIVDQFRKRPPHQQAAANEAPGAGTLNPLENLPDPGQLVGEEIWDRQWEENLLEAARSRVKRKANPLHYQLFDLYVRKEMSIDDITASLQVSRGQVYLAKHRIGRLLRKELHILRKQEW